MNNLIEKLKYQCVTETEDTCFSYYLLPSKNLYYLYLNRDIVEIKKTDINNTSATDFVNIKSNGLNNVIVEGLIHEKYFYITDVLIYSGKTIDLCFKDRLRIINNIYQKISGNVKILNVFSNILLENILEKQPKEPYILMIKNFQKYIISNNYTYINNYKAKIKNKTILIKLENKPKTLQEIRTIRKTDQSEIYVTEIEPTIWSVIKISDLKTSIQIKKRFENKKSIDILCTFNEKFMKYEPQLN